MAHDKHGNSRHLASPSVSPRCQPQFLIYLRIIRAPKSSEELALEGIPRVLLIIRLPCKRLTLLLGPHKASRWLYFRSKVRWKIGIFIVNSRLHASERMCKYGIDTKYSNSVDERARWDLGWRQACFHASFAWDYQKCNAIWCNAMQCNTMQNNPMECDAIRCDVMRCDMTCHNTLQCNTIGYNSAISWILIFWPAPQGRVSIWRRLRFIWFWTHFSSTNVGYIRL